MRRVVDIKAYYIQEADKPNRIKSMLSIITIDGKKIILPDNLHKMCEKRIKRLAENINKNMKKNNAKYVVLSKTLCKNETLRNELKRNNVQVLEGTWLWHYIAYETVKYVMNVKNIEAKDTEISILANNTSDVTSENIRLFSKDFKRVNMVTSSVNKFKKLERQIYDEYGIMVTITNNYKKSLAKSEIILNIDFDSENLNKYNIYENAVIINIEKNIKIKKKRFNGININNYELKSKRAEELFRN
jgi:hypothetical protein